MGGGLTDSQKLMFHVLGADRARNESERRFGGEEAGDRVGEFIEAIVRAMNPSAASRGGEQDEREILRDAPSFVGIISR